MRRFLRAAAACAVAIVAFLPTATPAGADELLVIPIRKVAGGAPGAVLSIGSVAVPADLVGRTCQLVGRTINQVSVHPGNDLLIITDGQTFVVPDFEDEGFILHEAGEVEALGPTVELQIRFGPQGVSSGGFSVSVECEPDVTATVPSGPTTTTEPTTVESTAAASTTAPSTTGPSTTTPPTTAPPTIGTPTTEATTVSTDVETNPPDTSSPTEPPPAGPTDTTDSTTTTASTTAPPPAGPSAGDDEVNARLPATGSSTGLLLGIGTAFIGFGLVTQRLVSTRRS
jgi:hypothetical protein